MTAFDVDSVTRALLRVIPGEVRAISDTLKQAGFRSWVVGGSVRDVLLALEAQSAPLGQGDWDLATDARPERVQKLFRKVIPTGIQHGTVTVVLGKQHFEITTLRGERGHTDGRRPDEVFFVDDLKEDLARRDFTVNAMAFSVTDGTFHDPFSGAEDLRAGLLRAVGKPEQRFAEDGLRVLRCARFCATLGLSIEQETRQAIRPSLASFERVAQERVCDEWWKALKSSEPSRFLRVVHDEGLLQITAPQIWTSAETLLSFEDALDRLDSAPRDPLLRFALFVRAGTRTADDPAQIASVVGARLRLSKDDSSRLVRLCGHAVLPEALLYGASGHAARLWLCSVGRSEAPDIFAMQALAAPATVPPEGLKLCHEMLAFELNSGAPLSLKELAVTGGDLITDAQIPKGPRLGETLAFLLSAVLADPTKNEREILLSLASEA